MVCWRSASPVFRRATRSFLTASSSARNCIYSNKESLPARLLRLAGWSVSCCNPPGVVCCCPITPYPSTKHSPQTVPRTRIEGCHIDMYCDQGDAHQCEHLMQENDQLACRS